jgi:hypothetical protein
MPPAVFGPIGHGGMERMIVYPAMLWMMAVGGYLMAAREADARPPRTFWRLARSSRR